MSKKALIKSRFKSFRPAIRGLKALESFKPGLNQRFQNKAIMLGILAVALLVVLFYMPAIPQDLRYHQFADQRTILGIPHFWNVFSNLPFLLIGVWAFWLLSFDKKEPISNDLMLYVVLFFVGYFLTGFGSSFYHWSPQNKSLVWDRLPMTLAFMPFFAMMLALHVNKKLGQLILWPLMTVGIFSVFYWNYTEGLGRGDLRIYAGVQFIPIIFIPLVIWLFPIKTYRLKYFWYLFAAYASAKIFEHFDKQIYALLPMSGHAIKHVAASLSGVAFFYLVKSYKPLPEFSNILGDLSKL